MKLITSNNNTSIFLNKYYTKDLNIDNRELLENYFRRLFKSLNKNFDFNISGYYNIKIHIDNFYGAIIELIKDDVDYFDYFINQVDMRILIEKNSCFLYNIKDYFFIDDSLKKKIKIYLYQNEMFLKINEELNEIELGKILENGTIIYGKQVDKISNKGQIINI